MTRTTATITPMWRGLRSPANTERSRCRLPLNHSRVYRSALPPAFDVIGLDERSTHTTKIDITLCILKQTSKLTCSLTDRMPPGKRDARTTYTVTLPNNFVNEIRQFALRCMRCSSVRPRHRWGIKGRLTDLVLPVLIQARNLPGDELLSALGNWRTCGANRGSVCSPSEADFAWLATSIKIAASL